MARRTVRDKVDESGAKPVRTLSIDIGGTGLKCSVLDPKGMMLHDKVWRPTPDPCPPDVMIENLKEMAAGLRPFERVSAGFPGAVRDGRVITAPHFPSQNWAGFDLAAALAQAFDVPARVLNDAEVQGLGVIAGKGLEFVLTLGTGAGTAIFQDGHLTPHLELAHHPVHNKKVYNQYIGRDALKKAGVKRWNKRVRKVIEILEDLVHYDRLYIGGGNAEKIEGPLPANATIVSNTTGITGGIALWKKGVIHTPANGGASGHRDLGGLPDPDR